MAESKKSTACNGDNQQFKKTINFKLDGTPYLNSSWKDSIYSVYYSTANESFKDMCQQTYGTGAPCGKDTAGKIYRALKKFFIFLKGVKKYYNKYVNGAINIIKNIPGEIQATIRVIAANLKTLIQRIREWILKKIRKGIEDLLAKLLPPLLKQIKSGLLKIIIDEIFCKLEDIIASLVKLVAEFLYALVGQIVNTPLCALDNFVNALLNKVASDIDKALGPTFDKLNQALGGVTKITGSIFQAIDFILGFEGFLCEKPNCNDELKEFSASPWGGPQNSKTDNWANFSFSEFADKNVKGWMNDFFGPRDENYVSPGGCYSGVFNCGIPQIQIFGGGGSGAVAGAVVNTIGQVIGANLFYGGKGYTSTPFVTIADPGNCGKNASAYAILSDPGDDGTSTVEKIVLTNPGAGYSDTYNGGPPVINAFVGSPNPIILNQSIVLSWDVTNATNVSLNIPGYTDLGLVQSVYLPISKDDVSFAAGKTETIKTYTLTATNKNVQSDSQVVVRNLDITVIATGTTTGVSTISNKPPTIDSFTSDVLTTSPGGLIKLTWETSNTTNVSLNVPGYSSIPEDGTVSLVIPSDYPIPSSGVAITSYTLTAVNTGAPIGKRSVTNTISLNVVPVSSTTGLGNTTTLGTDNNLPKGNVGVGSTTSSFNSTSSGGNGNPLYNPTNGVSEIEDIFVLDTGSGYKPTDTVSIVGGNNGADFSLNLTPNGQIVSLNIISPGYGFVTIPEITINSDTGVGAKFRANLKFTPLNEFLKLRKIESISPKKLVKIIDCVSR